MEALGKLADLLHKNANDFVNAFMGPCYKQKQRALLFIDPNYRAVCIKKKHYWNQDKEQPWRKSMERTSPDQVRPTGSEEKGTKNRRSP